MCVAQALLRKALQADKRKPRRMTAVQSAAREAGAKLDA